MVEGRRELEGGGTDNGAWWGSASANGMRGTY